MAPLRDTTKLLIRLRALMNDAQLLNGKRIQAYIVPSSDAHGSEYLNPKHKYREFISGFTGRYISFVWIFLNKIFCWIYI